MQKKSRINFDDVPAVIEELLSKPFWIPSLKPMEWYNRYEDDSPLGSLSVVFGEDGDGHISVIQDRDPNEFKMSMRFRMPMVGGGQSPRVRNALLILAEAIRLDNLDNPQQRAQ
jgi:hypothetical protein